MNEKVFIEIEKLDPYTKEGTECRQIALPEKLYEPLLDVVDYLYYPLEEVFGESVQVSVKADGVLVKIEGGIFRLTLTKGSLFV